MTRYIPPGVIINPMPPGFDVAVFDNGKVLKATIEIDGLKYEIGLRPKRIPVEIAAAILAIIYEIWQILELARIGRDDLIAYAAANRHTRGPPFRQVMSPLA